VKRRIERRMEGIVDTISRWARPAGIGPDLQTVTAHPGSILKGREEREKTFLTDLQEERGRRGRTKSIVDGVCSFDVVVNLGCKFHPTKRLRTFSTDVGGWDLKHQRPPLLSC
jgi:hypothetical protein